MAHGSSDALLCIIVSAIVARSVAANNGRIGVVVADELLNTVEPFFAGGTLDWWTADDPHNGVKWGSAGMLTLDLSNQRLRALVKARAPMLLRIGGTTADTVSYAIGDAAPECPGGFPRPATCNTTPHVYRKFGKKQPNVPGKQPCIGTSEASCIASPNTAFPCCWQEPPNSVELTCYYQRTPGCLREERWREILDFSKATGVTLVFGLNGEHGRQGHTNNAMDFRQIDALLNLTASDPELAGIVHGFELGNELGNGGVGHDRVEPAAMAASFIELKTKIDRFWKGRLGKKPILIGPDIGKVKSSNPAMQDWWTKFLKIAGPVLDAATYHEYTFGNSDNPEILSKMLQPSELNEVRKVAMTQVKTVRGVLEHVPVWAGEMGPASGGGQNGSSNRYVDSFWYLESLGSMAAVGVAAFARSTLCGGNYEMIDHKTFEANPDYYTGFAWTKLMGQYVLSATVHIQGEATVRSFAHCARAGGGIVVLTINLASHEEELALSIPDSSVTILGKPLELRRLDYSFRSGAADGDIQAKNIAFRVKRGESQEAWQTLTGIPDLVPLEESGTTVILSAHSFSFHHFPDVRLGACNIAQRLVV